MGFLLLLMACQTYYNLTMWSVWNLFYHGAFLIECIGRQFHVKLKLSSKQQA